MSRSADPKKIGERAHRHVLSFRFADGVDQFDEASNGALAFSARTTMSFPGAFPPVSLGSFEAAVSNEAGDVSAVLPGLFRIYALSHADPRATFFIDGGVLDNKPFGHVIGAIKRRPAESEVDRRLLFLEPDPGSGGGLAPGGGSPSPVATVLASVSGLPRQEPVLNDILDVNAHNERVRRFRDIIETSFDPIGARIEEMIGTELVRLTEQQTPAELAEWRTRINADAQAAAGFAYATYIRSKVSGVVDSFAQTIFRLGDFPAESNQAAFVRGVVHAWAGTRLFRDVNGRQAPVDDLVAFLRTFDLPYRARRLRFVIDGLSWWYSTSASPATRRARSSTRARPRYGRRARCSSTRWTAASCSPTSPPTCSACSPRRRSTRGSTAAVGPRSTRPNTPTSSPTSSRSSGRRSMRSSPAQARRSMPACSRSPRAGRPSGAPTSSSVTSAFRTGTSCSTHSRPSPTRASATRSRSSG